MTPKRAVFLDRDGTINEEREYLHRVEDFAFIPGAAEAIGRLKDAGFCVVVVTNQSGIGRGYYDEAALCVLHSHLDRELDRFGAAIDAYYFCPHHPEHGVGDYRQECACRKPMPGMLVKAAAGGSLGGKDYEGTLANNGVLLAPFHNFDSQISADLKAEIETLRQGIAGGTIKVCDYLARGC